MAKKNEFKERIKIELLKKFELEVVIKGMARVERWQRAAYGCVDWDEYCGVPGRGVEGVEFYCREVQAGIEKTFNKETFGIYKRS